MEKALNPDITKAERQLATSRSAKLHDIMGKEDQQKLYTKLHDVRRSATF